ncbi:MAG TPA: DUF4091 domain-containing protein [Armatimonadota bacterium]|nr:DUF4091 domain-containing protein [Armatimonadota bacterium]
MVGSAALPLSVLWVLAASPADSVPYTLWAAPSVQKVFRDAEPSGLGEPAHIYAAANEFEAVQALLTAGTESLEDVTVRVMPFRRERHAIGSASVTLYLAHYVPCPATGKDYPDPLPPLRDGFDVPAGTSQPIWIEVFVPKGTPAGDYAGGIVVTPANAPGRRLPLRLTVYGFELPDQVHAVTAFGISDDCVFDKHGVASSDGQATNARARLRQRYYEFLLEHKISPYYLPVDLRSPWASKYLNDPRLTSFAVPYREDEGYLRDIAAYLRERGLLKKAYFYVVDEPVARPSYDEIRHVAEVLHRVDPQLRLVAPFYRAPDWDESQTPFDELTGYLDIWCPNAHYFDLNPRVHQQIQERRAAGETAWCYVCCGPGEPYNNFFVQMSGLSHRLLFTQLWRLGVEGLLYWSTTYWAAVADPWTDMTTVPDINKSIYGDGSLLYPGKPVGIDGPVASIRLKIIRDGIEDYEYLRLLAQRRGMLAAHRAAEALCPSLSQYTRDPATFAFLRHKIAREIEPDR